MATKKSEDNILVIKTEKVPVKSLMMYHKNPRVGNVPEIAKSLHVNKQYRPIMVNIGTKTGRKNEILGSESRARWQPQQGVLHFIYEVFRMW